MKLIPRVLALSFLYASLAATQVFAQDHHDDSHQNGRSDHGQNGHDNHQYVRHDDWKKGHRMNHDDWSRGERVDYRSHHLNAPPRGYEWRQVDGNYVLAAAATGLIASVIAASAAH